MFKGDFKFNLHDALGLNEFAYFPQYEIAYSSTNEPIEEWTKLTPVKKPRVLTVTASGDQPLMYAATMRASHVDTFDLTINACAVMDFKTSALQMLNYQEYQDSVQILRHLDTINYNHIARIIDNMPERTRTLMQHLVKVRPIVFQRDMFDPTKFPTNEKTYKKIQKTVRKPFNFIWADLMNVPNYIEGKYDIINTSNVFEHYLGQGKFPIDIYHTIENLWPYLNAGGYILCTACYPTVQDAIKRNREVWDALNAKISFPAAPANCVFSPIVIQKTR